MGSNIHNRVLLLEGETFINNTYKSYWTYDEYIEKLNEVGYIRSPLDNTTLVFNAKLAMFLFSHEEIEATNFHNSGNVFQKVKGLMYFPYYRKAFNTGCDEFSKKFDYGIAKMFYKEDGDGFCNDVLNYFFDAKFALNDFTISIKCQSVIDTYPGLISKESIMHWGYYSGIVHGFFNLLKTLNAPIENYFNQNSTKFEIFKPTINSCFNFKKEIEQIKGNEFKNFTKDLNGVIISILQELTVKTSVNGRPFLTEEQFVIFLKRAFLDMKNLSIQHFNSHNRDKGHIISIFHKLFTVLVKKYSYTRKREPFIKIITENFDNWDYKTVKLYMKPNAVKAR
ncbi:MAG TPA: hypothetical protein PLQ09_01040 [Prolixibacteraceae bacterium]|nr:hypothetical protein [Prolixibacteraceae bacterium]